jgi:hypothetical protein
MRRVLLISSAWLVALALAAPAALANDGGQGLYVETNDKVVTNAGFILIIFFPLFVGLMSALQWGLEKRKERRKKAHKALARDASARGGW